jgi:hypothetical protein
MTLKMKNIQTTQSHSQSNLLVGAAKREFRTQHQGCAALTCIVLGCFYAWPTQAQINFRCGQSDSDCLAEESRAKARVEANRQLSPAEVQLLDPDQARLSDNLLAASGQASPERVASMAWELVFTRCSRPGSPAATYFLSGRDQSNSYTFPVSWGLTERQGLFPPPQPDPISEADRLNGVQWRGRAYFKVSVYRGFSFNAGGMMERGPWTKWSDAGPREWPTVSLTKKNNRWSVKFYINASMADLADRGSSFAGNGSPYEAAQYKMSCAAALVDDPFANLDGRTHRNRRAPSTDSTPLPAGREPRDTATPQPAQPAPTQPPAQKPDGPALFICPGPPGTTLRLKGTTFFKGSDGRVRIITTPTKVTVLRSNPDRPDGKSVKMVVRLEGDDVTYNVLQEQAGQIQTSCPARQGQ